MDRIGFALIAPGPYQNISLIHSLFRATPEPVISQIQINFSMTLNLLKSHPPEQIRPILDQSLAAFQQGGARVADRLTLTMKELEQLIQGGGCRGAEHAAVLYRNSVRLSRDLTRL
ncbi:MAG: hypothetical protein HQK55_18610, partial [Deltaproteobacteria bacterium]|nr:hypothetical protein [Deltaproteobacteria bacterium]